MTPLTRQRPPRSYADVMGLQVDFKGENKQGQLMFANGTPLVSDVFDTPEQAVERFGRRIKIPREMKFSTPFALGLKAASFTPRRDASHQERLEFALGYMAQLIDRGNPQPIKPVAVAKPPPILPPPAQPPPPPEPIPDEIDADAPWDNGESLLPETPMKPQVVSTEVPPPAPPEPPPVPFKRKRGRPRKNP